MPSSHLMSNHSSINVEISLNLFLPGFTEVVSDKVISSLPVWGPGYEISFEFYLHSDVTNGGSKDYQWLFAALGTDTGPGQPRIYFVQGKDCYKRTEKLTR